MKMEKNHVCSANLAWALDNPLRRWFLRPEKVVKEFIRPGYRVLDMGCGPGFFTLPMARMVGPQGKVLAVDLQRKMLEILVRKVEKSGLGDRIQFHNCSSDSLNFTSTVEPFDFMLLYYMVHETPDPGHLFAELRPLMKANGRILVIEPVFHVNEVEFLKNLHLAEAAGFRVDGPSRQKGGRCAVLSI